jgi:HK97 family phage portal protein
MRLFSRKSKTEELEERAEEPYNVFLPPSLPGYTPVGELGALSLPAFWRGVRLKVDTIGTLPLHGYRGTERLDVALLEQPDPSEDRTVTFSRLLTSLILKGNAFALLGDFDEFGYPGVIKVVPPSVVSFNSGTGMYQVAGEDKHPSEMLHVRGLTLAGDVFGLGCVEIHRRALQGAIQVDEFARNFFVDPAFPSGILKINKQGLSQTEYDDIITRWVSRQAGKRTPVALPPDIDFQPVALSNEDSQFLQTRVHTLTEVANIVGVPGYFIGAQGPSMTYSNAETESLNLLKFYLRGDMIALERAFSALLPDGIEARFNPDALLRMDTASRYRAHATALQHKFLSLDEVRELENREPLPEVRNRKETVGESLEEQ